MLTRFDLLLILLIVLAITGWPTGVTPTRLPNPILTAIVVIVLLVLLILGVVRA